MVRKRETKVDDDDDLPQVGRPRSPEIFGPPRPEPYERKEFANRLQAILDALEIPGLARDERIYLQKMLRRWDVLRSVDPRRFPEKGDERIILLLRSIVETANGAEALILPVIKAVYGCLHDAWTNRGLAWLEALDRVPILSTLAHLRDVGLEAHLEDAIRYKLAQILGPHTAPQPKLKPKRARKPATKPQRPDGISQGVWDAIEAQRLERKRKLGRECYRRRKQREGKKVRARPKARSAAGGTATAVNVNPWGYQ